MNILLISSSKNDFKKFISKQLQIAWNSVRDKDNRKQKKDFLQESNYFKIIDNKNKYESLDKNFIPQIVFIVPELLWDNDGVNEGYEIARELITKIFINEFLQVVFLSVLERKTLKKLVDNRNKPMVEAFPHICILNNIIDLKFEYYSEIHFKLLKHLALSNEGILQKIAHEMNSVKANISKKVKDVNDCRKDLINRLEELTLFQQWTETNIFQKIENVKHTNDYDKLLAEAKFVENLIEEIYFKIPKNPINIDKEFSLKPKSKYKVFIIEDDPEYSNFLFDVLSKFFYEVYPNIKNEYIYKKKTKKFDIKDSEAFLRQNAQIYNIFLIDLLLKDKEGNWLNFNGLDLFKTIRKVNKYAVIRIITGLPRGIITKLVEVIMTDAEKPNTDQVFTKKYGKDALKDFIVESIEKIKDECHLNEKQKTAFIPIPANGIFGWPGVREMIIALDKNEMKNIVEKAKYFYKKFQEGELNFNSQEWNKGKLVNTRKEGDYVGRVKKSLVNIMTYRLIILKQALKNKTCHLYVNNEESNNFEQSITNISKHSTPIDKNFLVTKLGFNVSEGKIEKDKYFIEIHLVNLFPHEYDFIFNIEREKEREKENEKLDNTKHPNLLSAFKEILSDKAIYETWEDLHLDFNPYNDAIKNKIERGKNLHPNNFDTTSFTVKNLRDFFQSLINNYSEVSIPQIVERISDLILDKYGNVQFESEDILTSKIIDQLINMIPEQLNDQELNYS